MGDAASRRHPVDVAGSDVLIRSQRIAMGLSSIKQIGEGGKSYMGMGPYVHALAGRKIDRTKVIEENERPDTAPCDLGQEAGDEKTVAKVVRFSGDGCHGASLAAIPQKL
jgi:hypothetical protein